MDKNLTLDEVKNNKEWVKLSNEKLESFKEILRVLVRYYSALSSDKDKSKSTLFREKLSTAKKGEVYIKKIMENNDLKNGYAYLIFAKLGKEQNTWLHLDGIAEERDQMISRGITNHPVFEIVCLGDLYDKKKVKIPMKLVA